MKFGVLTQDDLLKNGTIVQVKFENKELNQYAVVDSKMTSPIYLNKDNIRLATSAEIRKFRKERHGEYLPAIEACELLLHRLESLKVGGKYPASIPDEIWTTEIVLKDAVKNF